jgi:putative transposon-encoded protein
LVVRHRGKCHFECQCESCSCECGCICVKNNCSCCISTIKKVATSDDGLTAKEFKYTVKRAGNSGHIIVDKELVGKRLKIRFEVTD